MIKKLHNLKNQLFLVVFMVLISSVSLAQSTNRYQAVIRGGATLFGNSWYYSSTSNNGYFSNTRLTPDVDNDNSTTLSTSSDLILPAGSTIEKAYLAIEKGIGGGMFTSVKFKAPGAGSYTLLSTATALANNNTNSYYQAIWDVTSMMPANGYVSVASGGTAGRYFLADPLPDSTTLPMGGWSIIVVYSNPASPARNITVADNWQFFNNSTVNSDVTGVTVPASGVVNAVIGVTGTYGDRNYSDLISFGQTTGALTRLADPMTGRTDDALNSSIAVSVNNNVTSDGGPALSGNVTSRNPISGGHIYGPAEAWDYDADIFDAAGILPNSNNPMDVRLQQRSTGGDFLASGSYFISIDVSAPTLTKTVSPSVIIDGGIATYTWVVENTAGGAALLSNLGFVDTLPSKIKIAASPQVTTSYTGGGSGATVTAVAGSGNFSVSGLKLPGGATATFTVKITNVLGQYNTSCSGNPSAFTNSNSNVTTTGGIASNLTPQCLIVNPDCSAYVLAINNPAAVCSPSTVNLTAAAITAGSSSGQTYTYWTNSAATSAYASPTAATAGTYYIKGTNAIGCSDVKAVLVTVTPNNTVTAASSTPTLCINTVLTNITHTTTGATGIGTATGLPSGVTAAFASNTITISGTPTASGTFNYSIPLTGGCGTVNATGTITVTPANTAGTASTTPTLCINTALTAITHATTGATGIGTATGLPAGVTATFASNKITISGTPTASGTFNYSIPLTGGCGTVNATGTITVTPANTAGTASTTPTLCINTALTAITHTTTGATGIGTATGLPAGVTATFASNTITISGTPTASGTFNYSIPLTGGCGSVNATGTITVTPANTAGTASTTPTLCINTALTAITHTTTGATGIGTATGLPAGVTATFASNTITISGTPTASGTFNYSIP
ncbi:beta strand repeat-containing protein, partial [Flavobacterium muglaense]|nr:hypothetical protein [Flavobacterium muglaense]